MNMEEERSRNPRTTTVSAKYQVVIPKTVRRALELKPGDRLYVTVENGRVIMQLQPKSYTRHLRGLHKEIWDGIDATEYVQRERDSWQP